LDPFDAETVEPRTGTLHVDRSLLTWSDGEYRFIHLLVRDHLAECHPVRLAQAVHRRRAQLGA
jgi:hypothetical protein